jgi:hypothetical protein
MKGSVFAVVDELDEWMRKHSTGPMDDPAEKYKNVVLPFPVSHSELIPRNDILDFPLISGPGKARTAELVTLAYKLWESLAR